MAVLQINNLSKHYGKIKAVQHLNLEIKAGELYGILGPNGSGKTTTLAMLVDIIRPTSGNYSWFGQDSSAVLRRKIGTLLETPNFYPYLNAVQNLNIWAKIKGVDKKEIPKVLETVGLSERAYSAFRTFSLGMKQRLAIASALLGDPEVLIFDEPTNGLDPQGIVDVRELLIKIGARGKTILLASHIIDEVEKVCSHVAIIKKGRLLASGAVSDILSADPVFELAAQDLSKLQNLLEQATWCKQVKRHHQHIELQLAQALSAADLNRYLYEKGLVLTHLVKRKKSLESEFLERTQLD